MTPRYLDLPVRCLVVVILVLGLLIPRSAAFFLGPWFETGVNWAWQATGVIALLVFVYIRPLLGTLSFLIFALLYFQAYATLFQPSLSSVVPDLDYLFFDRISSGFCFSLATRYLINVAPPFMVFGAAFSVFKTDSKRLLSLIYRVLFGILASHVSIIAVQGLVNIHFLSSGSGSAVDTLRAPGLLEDSGASTIVISSLLVYFLGWSQVSDLTKKQKIQFGVLWMLGATLGFLTSGRSYITLLAAGSILMITLNQLRLRRFSRKMLIPVSILIGLVIAYSMLSSIKFLQGTGSAQAFADELFIVRWLGIFDPLRAAHVAIFLRSIPEYWPAGIGLGGSHITLAQYGHIYESRGISIAGDAPLNFFVAFVLELGFTGLFLLMWLLTSMIRFTYTAVHKMPHYLPTAVMGIALMASLMVGTQVILKSVATLLALYCALLVTGNQRWKFPWFAGVAAVTLALVVAYRYATIPLVPEFYWSKQGHPQKPLAPPIPIATPKGEGWRLSGVPFALQKAEIKIFIEFPPEYYPQHIAIEVFASENSSQIFSTNHVIEKYDGAQPWRIIEVKLPPDVTDRCTKETFSPENYCYMIVRNDPVWNIARGMPVGFFVVD